MSKIGELAVHLTAKTSSLDKALLDSQKKMKKFESGFLNLGKSLTKKVTLPLLALGAAAIKVGADFEQSITNAFAVTGSKSVEVKEQMEALARTMGEKTVFSAKEAADAMYWMGSAGWKVKEMTAALEDTLALAAATQSDLAYATEAVVVTIKQFGLSAADAGRVSNTFAAAIGNSQATLERLRESLKYIGPMADEMGWSLEDTTAALMVFYDAGIEASTAGTNLRMAMAQLLQGTDKAKEALGAMGLTLADVNPETKSLAEIIETLGNKGITTAQAIDLFGVRAGPNMKKMISQGAEAINGYKDAITDTTYATDMMTQQLDTLKSQWKIVTSKLVEAGIAISKTLIPALRDLIEKHVMPAINKFNALSEGSKKLVVKIALLVAALGPLMVILPKLIAGVASLKVGLLALSGSPIGLVIRGLLLIAERARAATLSFKDMFNELDRRAKASGEKMGWLEKSFHGVQAAYHKVVGGFDYGKAATRDLAMQTALLTEENKKLFKSTLDNVKETKEYKGIVDTVNGVLGLFKSKTKEVTDAVEAAKGEEKQFNQTVATTIELVETFVPLGHSMATVMDDLARSIGETAVPAMNDLRGVVYNTQASLETYTWGAERFGETNKRVTKESRSAWTDFTDGLRTEWANSISDVLSGAKSLEDGLKGIWDAIKNQFFDMIGQMVAKWITDFIGNILTSTANAGKELVSSFTSGVSNAVKGAGSALSGMWGGIIGGAISGLATIITGNKQKGAIDATNRELHNIWCEARNILNNVDNIKWIVDDIKHTGWRIADNVIPILDDIKHTGWHISGILGSIDAGIGDVVNAIGDISGAASGFHGTVSQPQLLAVHPNEQIDITPFSKPQQMQQSQPTVIQNYSFEIHAEDAQSFEDFLKRGAGAKVATFVQKQIDLKNIRVPMSGVGR